MLKTAGIIAASAVLTASAGVGASSATTPPTAPTKAPTTSTAPASNGPQGKAGDWIIPPEPTPSSGGTVGTVYFQLINQTSQTVTFNVNVSSDAQRETSLYSWASGTLSANPQVAPGQTVTVPVVAGGGGYTDSSDPVVTVGLEGYAQYEMWVNVSTWSNNNFENIEYKGDQTGGGYTGGLGQMNCGTGQVISNGNAGINSDWTYVNGT
ncbi:MAG: hypothetical protein WBZ04_14040, partial [Candidatus Nanopelagicales bacterium]